ncbi:hypothetical protein MFRU_075g00060 [Monilinia fructicola]|uniref:Uncharacterized protein n=1 Tax=Monilinia fructicola TaxID=38448 RepID=A0A5M9JWN8_MONFR|nr:hypothetical protein EYC84_000541 [Monilinia fructicola]KAG4024984.1 hypothetical protein MFRU_075g00060 [Monilinia fructicola]
MSCMQLKATFLKFSKKCAETLRIRPKTPKTISISAPFNFQEGPAVNLPGYSEDEISLMKEKAIASTAVVSDNRYTNLNRCYDSDISESHSGTGSHGCGIGRSVVYHARRASRGCMYGH